LYLTDVMEYYDQDEIQKDRKCSQAQRPPRGASGAVFGNPAHLLDATNYVQHAWDAVTSTTISNAWRKANIIPTLEQDGGKEEDVKELDDGMFDKIRQELSNISITEQEINEFLNSNNTSKPLWKMSMI